MITHLVAGLQRRLPAAGAVVLDVPPARFAGQREQLHKPPNVEGQPMRSLDHSQTVIIRPRPARRAASGHAVTSV